MLFVELIRGEPHEINKAQPVVKELLERLTELRKELQSAIELNDPDSGPIKDTEAKIQAIEDCKEWMREQLG